jgi:hypothetical protein
MFDLDLERVRKHKRGLADALLRMRDDAVFVSTTASLRPRNHTAQARSDAPPAPSTTPLAIPSCTAQRGNNSDMRRLSRSLFLRNAANERRLERGMFLDQPPLHVIDSGSSSNLDSESRDGQYDAYNNRMSTSSMQNDFMNHPAWLMRRGLLNENELEAAARSARRDAGETVRSIGLRVDSEPMPRPYIQTPAARPVRQDMWRSVAEKYLD